MFWFLLLLVVLIAFLVMAIINHRIFKTKLDPDSRYRNTNRWQTRRDGWLAGMVAVTAIWLIPSVISTAILTYDASDARNSRYVLTELEVQRDELLSTFEDTLSNEDYITLMHAAVPEDLVFLRNNPQVSEFLINRADRLVAVNAKVFDLRNSILRRTKGVCNVTENWFIPQLPFVGPDCELGDISTVIDVER